MKRGRVLLCLAVVIAGSFYGFTLPNWSRITLEAPSSPNGDALHIVEGLILKHSFAETLSWWTGPWAHTGGPYYRPLTSLLWWLEYHTFGINGAVGFYLVHRFAHLIFVLLVFGFLRRLLRSDRAAMLAVLFFEVAVAYRFFGLPSIDPALGRWIDDPEMWCGSAIVGACWALWTYMDGAPRSRLAISLMMFLLAISFKEMAYVLPFLALLLVAHENKMKTHWGTVGAFFALAICGVAYRAWALHGGGGASWSNGAWRDRAFINLVGGSSAQPLLSGDALALSIACAILGIAMIVCTQGKLRVWASAWWGTAFLAYLSTAHANAGSEDGQWTRFIVLQTWRQALPLLVLILIVWRYTRKRAPQQAFGYGWAFICYLPMFFDAITDHALYLGSLGWAILLASVATDSVQSIAKYDAGALPFRYSGVVPELDAVDFT